MKNLSIPINIDTETLKKQIEFEVAKRTKQEISYRLNLLFINPKQELECNAIRRMNNNDPDISVGYQFIKDKIDMKLLDDNFQKYIDNYIDENFNRILNTALEKALEHKANGMAYKISKRKINISQNGNVNDENV